MALASIRRLLIIFIGALALTRFINATYLPPIQDEAYYFYWSRFLDTGYFDHPPLVAWLSWPGTLILGSSFFARLGTIFLSFLAIPLLLSFMQRLGLKKSETLGTALFLAIGSLAAVLQGYITTPDIPLVFCWIAALNEAASAMDGSPKRWLSAGFFTGLGILGKYTMLLIGPVFLIALLIRPRQLRQPWPYLGGLVCVLTLLPHLLWLSQHDWITLRFQFGRGLQSIYDVSMESGSDLPLAKPPFSQGTESQFANYFKLADDEISISRPKPSGFIKKLQNIGDFAGGQLSLWGLLLFPLAGALWRRQKQKPSWANPQLKALAWAATLFPLGLFAMLSPVQHIEANWPAVYMIGAAAVLAQAWKISLRGLFWAASGNLFLTLLLSLHAHSPIFSGQAHKDRILKETHGYRELAKHLSTVDLPLFTDTYQNLSQISFYNPLMKIQQWPGIARSSELLRRSAMNPWQWQDIKRIGSFVLITDNFIPPMIPGAQLVDMSEALDCIDGRGLVMTRRSLAPYQRPCQKRVHRWSIAQYKLTP